jgi:hypothetical protein
MDYKQEYEYFYNKYYSHFEKLIKHFLMAQKVKKRHSNLVFNELTNYLANDFQIEIQLSSNPNLKEFLQVFEKRYSYYEEDEINLTFANEIKPSFDSIDSEQLPVGYTIRKLLIEIAIFSIVKEINRLLQSNISLFNLFYVLGDFSNFEIKHYSGVSLESTPIYKSLYHRLYPEAYENSIAEEDIHNDDLENKEPQSYSLPVVVALLNEIGFFELDKIKNLSPNNQAKIIALIQQKDINNKSLNRSISGNIRVLNPDNKEDAFKYTSHKHPDKVKSILNDIKLGNK